MMENSVDQQKKHRVLVIGIDGGTWDIFMPLIEKGYMPNLARLVKEGASGILQSTIPPVTAPAWSSFLTGKNPGKHGVFNFVQDEGEGEEKRRVIINNCTIKGKQFPHILGENGKKVGLINVPVTYPPFPVNGFMITGMLTPYQAEEFTYPPELKKKLSDYSIDLPGKTKTQTEAQHWINFAPIKRRGPEELINDCLEMHKKREIYCLSLMEQNEWDCLSVVFVGNDRLSHHLWPAIAALGDNNIDPSAENILRYYKALDITIGKMLRNAGNDATVIVMSDHGFGKTREKSIHLAKWLIDQQWLVFKKNGNRNSLFIPLLKRFMRKYIYKSKGLLIPSKLLKKIDNKRGTRNDQFRRLVDYDKTKVIFDNRYLGVFYYAGLVLNKDSEKQQGHLWDEVIAALKELEDPETNKKIIKNIFYREQIYTGRFFTKEPDIILEAEEGYMFELDPYDVKSLIKPTSLERLCLPGTHRREGMFVISGPQTKQGVWCENDVTKIEDIAPTILHLSGVAVPRDMDGRVLTECFTDEFSTKHPVRYMDSAESEQQDAQVYSADETEDISERLRGLGYL